MNVFWTKIIALMACLPVLLCGCSKDDEPQIANRTILVYMAANNSLGSAAADVKDLAEMRDAARAGALRNGTLLVFRAATDGSQTLFRIENNGSMTTLRNYDGSQYSIDADFMANVMRDAQSLAPANSYGLIMWSHAYGWTQNGQDDDGPSYLPKPQTWGDDRGHSMNITTLQRVLADVHWDWAYFDCCFMGCVEVAYQLRDVLPTMVASAAETPLDGMPYDQNLPLLFAAQPDLVGAAENTFKYYNDLEGQDRTCTIAVFDLAGMDALADATRRIYADAAFAAPDAFDNLPLALGSNPLFYDMGVYVEELANTITDFDKGLYDNWLKAYGNVVVSSFATQRLWDAIDLQRFTGMSTYIPRNAAAMTLRRYDTLDWYKDVAKHLLPDTATL